MILSIIRNAIIYLWINIFCKWLNSHYLTFLSLYGPPLELQLVIFSLFFLTIGPRIFSSSVNLYCCHPKTFSKFSVETGTKLWLLNFRFWHLSLSDGSFRSTFLLSGRFLTAVVDIQRSFFNSINNGVNLSSVLSPTLFVLFHYWSLPSLHPLSIIMLIHCFFPFDRHSTQQQITHSMRVALEQLTLFFILIA